MQRLFIMGCCLLIAGSLSGQQFGGNPPSLKWKQINTDSARIIFPSGMDSQANRVASIIHYMAANSVAVPGSVSLGNQLRKIQIVMQNQTTVANGYVQLGPFRSEFFLTPSGNNFELGSISWPDQLALHEYRHVQQFNNFNNGLSRTMKVLFGEEGFALAINASVPDWFFEGDAVYNETFFSSQGRHNRKICSKSALEGDCRFHTFELREAFFQLNMQAHRPSDRAPKGPVLPPGAPGRHRRQADLPRPFLHRSGDWDRRASLPGWEALLPSVPAPSIRSPGC